MYNTCDDSQFEIIARAKDELISATNIEDSPDEMAVIDEFLFRCWQMGWLNAKDKVGKLRAENLQLRMLVAAYDELTYAIYRYWSTDKDPDTIDDVKRINKEIQILRNVLEIEADSSTYVRHDSIVKDTNTCKRLPIKDWLWQCSACGSRHDYGHLYNYCPNCGRKLEDECDLNILKDKSKIEVK